MANHKNMYRYLKQMLLEEVGTEGQQKIQSAKVAVIGVGGLGCPILQYLNAAGVGTLGLIDNDKVEIPNLHRQILFTPEDTGRLKVDAAADALSRQNPDTRLLKHPERLAADNARTLLADYDIVIDGCDNFATRYLSNDTCVALQKPLVYGSILGFEAQLATFNLEGSKNLRDLFPEPPDPEEVPDCNENGVLGTATGIVGSMLAQEALKLILGLPLLQNQLLLLDMRHWRMQTFRY